MAAVRAGFQLIWGTEICPDHPELGGMCNCGNNLQQRMWQDLTGTECLGNCFTNMEKFSTVEDTIQKPPDSILPIAHFSV